jgi:hypothetical protein
MEGDENMSTDKTDECCPQFDPRPWDEVSHVWEGRRFVKDRVSSIFHIPMNFSGVMKRNFGAIENAGARPENMIVLSDENSPWGADVYFEATKDVPGAVMATLTGTFLSKTFEGSYRNMRRWIEEMKVFVKSRGKKLQKMYFFYVICPKCSKKHGKNNVVILAQV